jgi:hypothetical protein
MLYLPACVFIRFCDFVLFNLSVNGLIDCFTSLFADIVYIAGLTMEEARNIYNGAQHAPIKLTATL